MQTSNYLSYAQFSFFLFLTPCIFLMPSIFRDDLGISNYGTSPATVVFYTLGFLSSAYFTWLASGTLSRHSHVQLWFRSSLRAVAIMQLALLLIPDSTVDIIRYGHLVVGISLFTLEFAVSGWMILRTKPRLLDYALLLVQALAGISAFLSLGHTLVAYEAQSQLVFHACFTLLSVRAAKRVENN